MTSKEPLLSLFLRCLNADYVHTSEGGDYALELVYSHLYLLFEWSDGREDWHKNLSFSARKVNPKAPQEEQWHAHRGFLKVWNAMRDEVIEKITETTRQNHIRAITCVGYSHGAALSLLATEGLSRRCGQHLSVEGYGFGCPRVVWGGLPDTVRQHLADFHTVRNIPDLVTHLPPTAFGFRHVNLTEIGQKGKYGPIEAHTFQAYIHELSQYQQSPFAKLATRSAVSPINPSMASGGRWVFRTAQHITSAPSIPSKPHIPLSRE